MPFAQIKLVVGQIDESKEAHESRLRLVQLQQQLRGDFEDLVVPARKFVREASVQEVPTRGSTLARPLPSAHSLIQCLVRAGRAKGDEGQG